ncbi:hypothetical protein BDR26DRAFT_930833 [Obelidium mucronatum]|nr:hypothetical protein BDR26DRAFT_930833 [Obelidium mucronatum]
MASTTMFVRLQRKSFPYVPRVHELHITPLENKEWIEWNSTQLRQLDSQPDYLRAVDVARTVLSLTDPPYLAKQKESGEFFAHLYPYSSASDTGEAFVLPDVKTRISGLLDLNEAVALYPNSKEKPWTVYFSLPAQDPDYVPPKAPYVPSGWEMLQAGARYDPDESLDQNPTLWNSRYLIPNPHPRECGYCRSTEAVSIRPGYTFQYRIEQLADYDLELLNGETGAVFADETLLSRCPPSCEARPWIIQLPVPNQPLPAWDNEEPVSQEETNEFLSRGREMRTGTA